MKRAFDMIEQRFERIELYRAPTILFHRPIMQKRRQVLTLMQAAIILSVMIVQTLPLDLVSAQSSSIPLSQEFASGDLQVSTYLQAWYTWVNINGTHTIFLALHSQQAQSPVFAFVGQAYNTSSGSQVFVGNAMLAMEVYNDTNKNGFLDANYATGSTELKYTLIMNASQTFTTNPVHKTSINGSPHYLWGITYGSVQAILIKAIAPDYGYGGGIMATDAIIDHVAMFYDYSLSGNTTFLKTSYNIGNVTLASWTPPGVTLQELSLSLLHTTLSVSSKQLTVTASNSPYDSQVNTTPSLVNVAEVKVDNILAYEFRFKDNYTLFQNPATSYPAVYLASPSNSLPTNAFQGAWYDPLLRVQNFVQGQLPDIAGLPASSNLNYSASKLIYRISYPTWSGNALTHDPTYVAHLGPGIVTTSPPPSLPTTILAVAVFTGVLALVVAVHSFSRSRKHQRSSDELENLELSSNPE